MQKPDDIELLMDFADLLSGKHFKNPDRAAKLVLEAIHYMESQPEPDTKRIEQAERLLTKLDPKRRTLGAVLEDMAATANSIIQRYDAADLPLMVMDVSWRMGRNLEFAGLFDHYERALRESGKSLQIWDLAYNEKNLEGWNGVGEASAFKPDGTFLRGRFGEYDPANFAYQMLTLDKVTSGDFSMEAEVLAKKGEVNFAGFVFGRKGTSSFHGMFLFPGRAEVKEGVIDTGFIDLMSSYGSNATQTWRHIPVKMDRSVEEGMTTTGGGDWHTMRIDIAGRFVDMWFDGELLATHDFPSAEVLRGAFGLICGPGEMRFRDVRYLSRDPKDPASRIEREIRMEALAAAGGESGGSTAVDSFLGVEPPWPKVSRWAQGERASWDEVGPVPQLLVFFSREQNTLVPIDEWLVDLADRTSAYGLEIVAICSPNDDGDIDAYLGEHPLPGSVGVDNRDEGTFGIGDTFTKYAIDRWGMPRLILIDIDGRVVWEGDPGFVAGEPYDPDLDSFLADPLGRARREAQAAPALRVEEEVVDRRRARARARRPGDGASDPHGVA